MIFSHTTRVFLALSLFIGGTISLKAMTNPQVVRLKPALEASLNAFRRQGVLPRQNIQILRYQKPEQIDIPREPGMLLFKKPVKPPAAPHIESSVVEQLRKGIDEDPMIVFRKRISDLRKETWDTLAKRNEKYDFFTKNELFNTLKNQLDTIPNEMPKEAYQSYIKNMYDIYKETYGTLAFLGKTIEAQAAEVLRVKGEKYKPKFEEIQKSIKDILKNFDDNFKQYHNETLTKYIATSEKLLLNKERDYIKFIVKNDPVSRMLEEYKRHQFQLTKINLKVEAENITMPLYKLYKMLKVAVAGGGLATAKSMVDEKIAYNKDLLDKGISEQRTRFDKQLRYDNSAPRFKDRLNREKIALAESYITGLITVHDSLSGQDKVLPAEIDLDRAQALIDEVSKNNPNSPEITALAKRLTEEISQAKIQKALYDRTKIDQLGGRLMEHLA